MLREISSKATLDPLEREILAQGKSLEIVGQVDPPQIRMAGEADAEHVVGLPLGPIRRFVDRLGGVDLPALGRLDGQAEALAARETVKLIEDLETGTGGGRLKAIQGDDVQEGVESLLFLQEQERGPQDGRVQTDDQSVLGRGRA